MYKIEITEKADSQIYRVLAVERHLIFYKFIKDEDLVTIYAVVDGRREFSLCYKGKLQKIS